MSLRNQSIVRIAALCFALCAALGATPTARAQQPNEIKFGAMPLGSIWYVFAASFSKYIQAGLPPGAKLGIDPLAAHFFVMYYCVLSMITPPVALASYAAAGLAKADARTPASRRE